MTESEQRESETTELDPGERYQSQLLRGVFVNVVGLVAKLFHPVFYLALTWAFGPALMGVYFTAVFASEIALSLVGSGFADATTIYASHHADDERAEATGKLYTLLGNIFAITLGASALVIVVAHLGADAFASAWYADYPDLGPAFVLLAWSIPFSVVSQVAIAATKARFRMEYDALIVGFLTPFCITAFSLVAWWLGAGLEGLMVANLVTRIVVAVASVWAMGRNFELGRILRAALAPKWDRAVLAFSLPQNLNLTFNRYNTRLDAIMLGALGSAPEIVAFYSTGSIITTNIRQIKLVFSSSLAPIVARHHHAGETKAFESVLSRISRWTTSMVIAAILALIVLRDDIVRLVDESYVGDTSFIVVLLLPPFLSCAVGLAGNCITWCGHSRWTLLNSSLIAGVNTVLNLVLIPPYGLLGAATATAIAALSISVLQLWELHELEGVVIRWSAVWWPHVAFAIVGAATLLVFGDPASVGSVLGRIGLAVGLLVAYVALLWGLGHPEVRARVSSAASG